MNHAIVRFQSLELTNFKNVAYGKIGVPSVQGKAINENNAEILGIYGQNGSGKTAVVEALMFLRQLLCGMSLPENIGDYIMKNEDMAICRYKFYLRCGEEKLLVTYSFSVRKTGEKKVELNTEKLLYSIFLHEKWQKPKTLMNYDVAYKDAVFKPIVQYNALIHANKENFVGLGVAKRLSRKELRSFLFSDDVLKIIGESCSKTPEYNLILQSLRNFSRMNFFVIKNEQNGAISLDIALPFSFKYNIATKCCVYGELAVSLKEPTVLNAESYRLMVRVINDLNIVISSLIPDMRLAVKEYGAQMTATGAAGIRFEVLSVRGECQIPLRYESEGIKRILSILNLLIVMYNNPSMCVVIDELDAGVYEYLLGELLEILQESGKGQLIFTSHNLRPLELIRNDALVFTTTNPQNRYLRMKNDSHIGNSRDAYIRSIHLGGQKESIYESSNEYEIRRAFRKAGRELDGGN